MSRTQTTELVDSLRELIAEGALRIVRIDTGLPSLALSEDFAKRLASVPPAEQPPHLPAVEVAKMLARADEYQKIAGRWLRFDAEASGIALPFVMDLETGQYRPLNDFEVALCAAPIPSEPPPIPPTQMPPAEQPTTLQGALYENATRHGYKKGRRMKVNITPSVARELCVRCAGYLKFIAKEQEKSAPPPAEQPRESTRSALGNAYFVPGGVVSEVLVWEKSEPREVIVTGTPIENYEAHNCDALGCGQAHVLWRHRLAAPPAVVGETAPVTATALDKEPRGFLHTNKSRAQEFFSLSSANTDAHKEAGWIVTPLYASPVAPPAPAGSREREQRVAELHTRLKKALTDLHNGWAYLDAFFADTIAELDELCALASSAPSASPPTSDRASQ